MALSKNKTGIMAAISAAAEGANAPTQDRAHRALPKGTIGSVRAGLGGIQDIDTALILPWGPQDRLEFTAVNSDETESSIADLMHSITESGQQVPVLLRPAPARDGHFEVIYGRRRILACKQLGLPVKALIRTLDDGEALMAKGLENSARLDLSFYERARFAKSILDQGHDRTDAMQALAVSKSTLSQLERITRTIPDEVGDLIGAAPGAGRPKWMALVNALEAKRTTQPQIAQVIRRLGEGHTSDDRLEAVLKDIAGRGARQRVAQTREPVPGVTIKSGQGSLSMSMARSGDQKAFTDWVEGQLSDWITQKFREFKKQDTGK